MRIPRVFLGTIAFFSVVAGWMNAASAADWPAWKGPNRDSLCQEKGLLKEWPEGGPKLAWKVSDLGEGYGGPAIVGNILYIAGHKDGKQYVFALDVSNEGKQVWATEFGPVRNNGAGFPGIRSTPTIDGDRLYILGIAGELVCMDVKDGHIVWQKDFVKDFGGSVPQWGYAESPLIDGPHLICTPGGKDNTIVALNKTDGSMVWHSAAGDKAAYASVIKGKLAGRDQYVNLTHEGVIGVDAQTGELLWRYDGFMKGKKVANCTTCVISGDSVFGAAFYDNGGGRADIAKDGDKFTAKEVFYTKKMQNHHGGVVLLDGMLYGSSSPNVLRCIDFKTGEEKWSDKGPGKCSVLYADGMLYCRDEKGPITLVEATPEGYKQHGQFKQPDRSDKNAWPHPVIANGMLYIRDQNVLLCYEVKEQK